MPTALDEDGRLETASRLPLGCTLLQESRNGANPVPAGTITTGIVGSVGSLNELEVSLTNACTAESTCCSLTGLRDAVRKAKESHAHAMVIKSDGPLFSGGADVVIFRGQNQQDGRELLSDGMDLIAELEDAPSPSLLRSVGSALRQAWRSLSPAISSLQRTTRRSRRSRR